jgi:hypothetical protein
MLLLQLAAGEAEVQQHWQAAVCPQTLYEIKVVTPLVVELATIVACRYNELVQAAALHGDQLACTQTFPLTKGMNRKRSATALLHAHVLEQLGSVAHATIDLVAWQFHASDQHYTVAYLEFAYVLRGVVFEAVVEEHV